MGGWANGRTHVGPGAARAGGAALSVAVLLTGCGGAAPNTAAAPAWRTPTPVRTVSAPRAMVVSEHPLSSAVGAAILRRGGNAIDAAVAVGFAQAVVNPAAGNLGGGGFLLYRQANGEVFALDYREAAPGSAAADMYIDAGGRVTSASVNGALAAGVPGSVAGLEAMHRRFGRLPWREVVLPAVELARGHVLDSTRARWLAGEADRLARYPSSRAALVRADRPWRTGDTLRQNDLARTLTILASEGADAFYRGPIAAQLVAEMRRSGGLISRDDLARYRAEWRTPLRTSYRGWEVWTMPPASGGGITLLQALNILEGFTLPRPGSADLAHLQVEALRRAFLDRNALLGDPAFVAMPVEQLISKPYAAQQRAGIVRDRATPLEGSPLAEGRHTTHYSIVDSAGNAASITTTINTGFGSGLVVGGAGFLLNNEMDDFTTQPGAVNAMGIRHEGTANAIVPGKRMLSSMTPTIALDPRGQLALVLGSPGGATIISAVLQVLVHVIDHGMRLEEAVAAPRLHHNGLPDLVDWEPNGLGAAVRETLRARGHHLAERPGFMATVNAIRVTPKGLEGVSDPRVPGGAVGW
ncbi:MAG: gamma-glutamyltransferase [Gemmatimonadales bacterium]|nr:gamma-glutamyltransferase [Gemmatimonadales bacterium]